MRTICVSVDLDGLDCYAEIHGLQGCIDDRARRAVPEVALQRFCELFDSLRMPATLFVIGREVAIAPEGLRAAAQAGHELGSHSFAHDYAMSRWPLPRIEEDLSRCEEELARAGLPRPRGFRAPGYTMSGRMFAALRARGYLYDSSLLPSAPYYLAKMLAIGLHALRGRRSQSILGGIGQLFARRGPHLREGVRELPCATAPLARLPLIGTSLLAMPSLARLAGDFFNLELHGIDALDASDVPREIAQVQPGIALPAGEKLRRLRAVIERFGGERLTLRDAARLAG